MYQTESAENSLKLLKLCFFASTRKIYQLFLTLKLFPWAINIPRITLAKNRKVFQWNLSEKFVVCAGFSARWKLGHKGGLEAKKGRDQHTKIIVLLVGWSKNNNRDWVTHNWKTWNVLWKNNSCCDYLSVKMVICYAFVTIITTPSCWNFSLEAVLKKLPQHAVFVSRETNCFS